MSGFGIRDSGFRLAALAAGCDSPCFPRPDSSPMLLQRDSSLRPGHVRPGEPHDRNILSLTDSPA